MIFQALASFLFLFIIVLIQAGTQSALPEPFRSFSLILLIGVLIFHFIRPSTGAVWIIVGAIFFDIFSAPGFLVFPGLVCAAAGGLILSRHVFMNRSLYAMMGLGISMSFINYLISGILSWFSHPRIPYLLFSLESIFLFSLILLLTFFVSRRVRKLLE